MSKKQAHEIGIPSVCPWTAGACRDSADRVEKCQIYPPHTGAMCMHVPLIAGRLFPAHIHDDDILCQSDLDSCFPHLFLVLWAFRLLGLGSFEFAASHQKCPWAQGERKKSLNRLQIVSYYYNLLLLLLFSLIMSKKRAHEIGIPSVCPWTAGACRDSADRVEKCRNLPSTHGCHVHACALDFRAPFSRSYPWRRHFVSKVTLIPVFLICFWCFGRFRLLGLGSFEFAASHQ